MYCFFKQPQLNIYNNALTSTELMVFKKTNNQYQHCQIVNQLNLLNLIRSLDPEFQTKLPSVAINCTQSQFTNVVISDALINLQHQIYPRNLRIEITLGKSLKQINLLIAQAENYRQHGIQVSLDAVDQITNFDVVAPFILQTREIKFGLNGRNTDRQLLQFWQTAARRNRKRFIVYNVETDDDIDLLDDLDIALCQGNYYSEADKLITEQSA